MYYAEFTVEGLGANYGEGIFYDWMQEDISEDQLEDWGFGKIDGSPFINAGVSVFVEFIEVGINSAIYFEILLSRYVLAGGDVEVTREH